MNFDGSMAFMILLFAAVFTAGQGIFGLITVASQKRLVNRRLAVADRVGGGLSTLVVELRKQRGLNAAGERKGWTWLTDLIVRSGLAFEPRRWTFAVAGSAMVCAIAGAILAKSLPAAAIGALIGATVVPVMVLKFCAGRRDKALGHQLPQALDIVTRSLEAGHPVPVSIALVGKEMADPIGTEFGMTADEIAYGATLSQAIERMADRCRHADVDLFAATVRLQERAGGNLTNLLKLNANTVRERHKMRLKIRAASSEGRASAMILTSAPFIVAGGLQLSSPHFYGDVIHEPFIQIGLVILGVWMFFGNLVMRRMIDMRI
jgi:tight adherence protein B